MSMARMVVRVLPTPIVLPRRIPGTDMRLAQEMCLGGGLEIVLLLND
jgi:hypothetical protein